MSASSSLVLGPNLIAAASRHPGSRMRSVAADCVGGGAKSATAKVPGKTFLGGSRDPERCRELPRTKPGGGRCTLVFSRI